jgi:hypothetical protein
LQQILSALSSAQHFLLFTILGADVAGLPQQLEGLIESAVNSSFPRAVSCLLLVSQKCFAMLFRQLSTWLVVSHANDTNCFTDWQKYARLHPLRFTV